MNKETKEEFRKFCDSNTILEGSYNKAFIKYKEMTKNKSLLNY